MKRFMLFLSAVIITAGILAQVPQGISHQAVMRDADNNLIAESPIGLQVSILQGAHDGNAVYVETHQLTSNQNGLITYIIGDGNAADGVFQDINWGAGPYWLETKADPTGGEDYSITGVTKFFSVPYSMYAEFAGHAQTFAGLDALLARIEALEDALDNGVEDGTVTDIDGNVYQTVIIGSQEWMAENLRVTRYNNEDDIPTGLSVEDWENATSGAYSIYPFTGGNWPNEPVEGINSDEEMVEAYGKLYNWYTVIDDRGLCPTGWSVPGDADWTVLVNYLVSQGYPNEWNNPNGAGNALKSCLQDGSPLIDCNVSEHPRWNSNDIHSGFDEFDFSALSGGFRGSDGNYGNIGGAGIWWTATEFNDADAWERGIYNAGGNVGRFRSNKRFGYSVLCFREMEN